MLIYKTEEIIILHTNVSIRQTRVFRTDVRIDI